MPRLVPPRKSTIMEAVNALGIDPKSLSNEGFGSNTGSWANIVLHCGDVNSLKRRCQYYDVWRYKPKEDDTGEEDLHSVNFSLRCSSPLDLSKTMPILTFNEYDSDETISVNSFCNTTQEFATNMSVQNEEDNEETISVKSLCDTTQEFATNMSVPNEYDSEETISVTSLCETTQEFATNMSVPNEYDSDETISVNSFCNTTQGLATKMSDPNEKDNEETISVKSLCDTKQEFAIKMSVRNEKDSKETISAHSPCRRRDEVVVHSIIERPISTDEAVHILQNVTEHQVTLLPPVTPKSGDVYVFTYERSQNQQDWRADPIMWKNHGTRTLKTTQGLVKVRYFLVRNEGKEFRKRVYELCRKMAPYFLVQYLGDDTAYTPRPHGNSKSQRPFIRTAPSVLHDIRERRQEPPEKVYLGMTNQHGDSQLHKSSHEPRNKEQVQNTIKRARLKDKLHSNELMATYILCHYLEGFVRDMRIYPELFVIAIVPEMLDELRIMMANTDGSAPNMLHYDTTFDLGNFYLSPLLFCHESFEESPVVPLAFLIHQTKKEKTHTDFFRALLQLLPEINSNRFVLCTDREAAIENAIRKILPNLPTVNCWNHLIYNVHAQVREMCGERADAQIYTSHIRELLEAETVQDWDLTLELHSQNWSLPFEDYFKKHLEVPMKKSARFALQNLGLPHLAITNNPSESFNAKLKRLVEWKQVTPDKMLLILFEIQTFYLNEILRGRCSLGNYHLINKKIASTVSNTTFPPDVLSMEAIVALYEDSLSIEDIEKKKELDEQAAKSRQTMATLLVAERKVVLEGLTQSFIVTGWNGQKYLTTLHPKESCTCTVLNCCHILAARLSIGLETEKKKTPITLKKLVRKAGRKRSGQKGPTKESKEYFPASDSKAKKRGRPNPPSEPQLMDPVNGQIDTNSAQKKRKKKEEEKRLARTWFQTREERKKDRMKEVLLDFGIALKGKKKRAKFLKEAKKKVISAEARAQFEILKSQMYDERLSKRNRKSKRDREMPEDEPKKTVSKQNGKKPTKSVFDKELKQYRAGPSFEKLHIQSKVQKKMFRTCSEHPFLTVMKGQFHPRYPQHETETGYNSY